MLKKIIFKNVSFGYRKSHLLFSNLNFTISTRESKGSIFSLMGRSGIGKTTFLKLLMGLEKAHSGRISISPESAIFSYIPQKPILFNHLTPLENAEYFNLIKDTKERFDKHFFNQIAKILNINHILYSNRKIDDLSGGEQQRILLLRALSIKPDILLLDEPLTGLDINVKKDILMQLKESSLINKTLVFYVTHHPDEAKLIADSVLYLHEDPKKNGVDELIYYDLSSFIDSHPHIELVDLFFPSEYIVFRVFFGEGEKMKLISDDQTRIKSQSYFLVISQNDIKLSEMYGFEIDKIFEASSNILVKMKSCNSTIILKKRSINKNQRFLFFENEGYLYNSSGLFLYKVKINKDFTVNHD